MNIRKLIRVLFKLCRAVTGYPIYWLSGFMPRNKKIWVFGSYGVFNDNSSYLYQSILNNPEFNNIRVIWISKNKNSVLEANKYGESYWLYSLRGIYYSLFAGVYIFSAYIHDINFFLSRKSYKINLWHGIPLKKIEFDITTKPLVNFFREANFFYKFLYPSLHVKYDLVLSPSNFVTNYSFKSAFRIENNNNIITAPYPRLMSWGDEQFSMDIDFLKYKKIFFYAPTWRDYDSKKKKDFFKEINFSLLNDLMMQNNSLLIVKFHSATIYNKDFFLSFDSIKVIDNNLDPINILASIDVLITDYSSIYFDFLYLTQARKMVIYFPFDLDEYLSGREMYFSYDDVTPGPKVLSFSDLLITLKGVLSNEYIDRHISDREKINKLFNDFTNISERNDNLLINKILDKLELLG